MRRPTLLATLALVALGAFLGAALVLRGRESSLPIPGERHRFAVEVLNGTSVDGLARETTRRLRRAEIDVVYFGDASEDAARTTRILIRRGDSSAAVVVRDVLGTGDIISAPNARLLVDVSVILGRDLAPGVDLDP